MALNLTPLGDGVIIEPADEEASTSSGGIIIPDTAKEKPQQGSVVAAAQVERLTKVKSSTCRSK